MRRSLCALLLLVLSLLPSARADAQEVEGTKEQGRADVDWTEWTPAVSVGFSFFSQDTRATTYGAWHSLSGASSAESPVSSTQTGGCPTLPQPNNQRCRWITELGDGNPIPPEVTPPTPQQSIPFGSIFYKRDILDGPAIPFTLELMAPALPFLPGRPRLFGEAGYGWPREPRFLAARARAGGNFTDGPQQDLYVKMDKMWWAGVGVAFQTQLGAFPLQIRPSFNYFGQQAHFDFFAKHPQPGGGSLPIEIGETRDEVYHGLGPKLGFGIEMGRRGPLAFGLVASTQLTWFPARLRFVERGIVKGPPPGTGGGAPATPEPLGNETFDFAFDDLQIGGSLAFRISWVGLSE